MHDERAIAASVQHVHGNLARDVAIDIAAAKGIVHRAAKEIEGDIAIDVGCLTCSTLRAAEHINICTTFYVEGDIAGDVRQVRATVEGADGEGTCCAVTCECSRHITCDNSFIGTSERFADEQFLTG